jgi:hypothetical protein
MKALLHYTVVFFLLIVAAHVSARASDTGTLHGPFDLAVVHSPTIQYFTMESRMMTYALNGDRLGTDVFRMYLKCVPSSVSGKDGDEFTCLKFTVQLTNTPESEIPALKNWSYLLSKNTAGIDEKGQVFGIDHAQFTKLVDANGSPVPPDKGYHVYNAFIDFHGVCTVFAEPMDGGSGIQDLKSIGQKIVHAAAHSEAPVHLGDNIEKGSTFKNGKVTLEFKGLSLVNAKECALIEYDSGESSFKMKMKPMPNMEIPVVGSSHYKGDIYKDLRTGWVLKANLSEMVVSEVTLPVPPNKINSVIERAILLNNVEEHEMLRLVSEKK